MSEIFQKRETLTNPIREERINVIQSKINEIKNTKQEEDVQIPDTNNKEEYRTWLGEHIGEFTKYLASLGIDITSYTVETGIDIGKSLIDSIVDGLIPEEMQNMVSDNLNSFTIWLNKKTKSEKIISLIDEIYVSNFSISKNNGKYIIKDAQGNEIKGLLEIFNNNSSLSEVLDETLISRSLTEAGEEGVLSTIRFINIDIVDKDSIDKVKPIDLANAYIKEYNIKKSNGEFYKLNELTSNILDSITPKIPNHIKDYILMTKDGVFDNNDMGFLKDALEEYREITTNTEGGTQIIKETMEGGIDSFIEIFENPGEAFSKIGNGMSALGLIALIGYGLFFHEKKKTFWGVLLGIFGGDALVDIIDGEDNHGLFSLLKKGNKKGWEILDGKLDNKEYVQQLTKDPKKTSLIIELTTVKSSILFENFSVGNDGIVTINNIDNIISNPEDKKEYIEIFGSEELFKKALQEILYNFLTLRKQGNEPLIDTKNRLEQKYNTTDYPNARFGEILLVELSGVKTSTQSEQQETQETQNNNIDIPQNIIIELNKLSSTVRSSLEIDIKKYLKDKNNIQNKTSLITLLESIIPDFSGDEKIALQNILNIINQ